MRLDVLGFSGAAPLDGACSSYVVRGSRGTVLLDCGPGTLERVWRRGLLDRLDAVVISHMHVDHVLDLVLFAGEVTRSLLGGRRIALHVPADRGPEVLQALDSVFPSAATRGSRFDETFDVSDYRPADRIDVGDLSLTFAPTAHPQPCCAARVTDGRSVLVYGADGSPSDALTALAREADLLVLEATFVDDDGAAAEHGHMTAAQAGELAARARARRLLLTHLLPGSREALIDRAARSFTGPIDVASEGLSLDV